MNQSESSHPDTDQLADPAARPGQRLRAQRELRGIGIERIAAQLHLRHEVVEALEQDRYEALPAPVFVTGYLSNYARLLGIDPQPIVQSYRASLSPVELPMSHAMPAPSRPGHAGGLWVSLISLALVGAVIGMIVLWWQDRARLDPGFASDLVPSLFGQAPPASGPDSLTESPLPPDQTPAAVADPPVDPALEPVIDQPSPAETAASTAAPAVEPVVSPLAPAAPSQPVPNASSTPSQPPAAAVQPALVAEDAEPAGEAAPAEIVLEFSGATWVTVRGSDGKVVLNGEMRDGDRRVLGGQPPYQFVIGNAAATRMTVGGEPFDVANRARGNVARFSLDPTVE